MGNATAHKSSIKRKIDKSVIILDQIKIKDPQIWDVMKTEDFVAKEFESDSRAKELAARERELNIEGRSVQELTIDTSVTVEVHAPLYFQSIQQVNGVTTDVLLLAMNPKANREMVFKAGEGAGASGSFFFFTHDKRFIIKTMTKGELSMFLDLLPYYELHLKENKDSLISRIYGVYTIHMKGIATVHLMLMANTLNFRDTKRIQRIFDIKGSTVARTVGITPKTKPTATLKDMDYIKV